MRTTNDRKDSRIVIRLNDRLNEYLRTESSRQNKSISDYIRDLISKDIREKKIPSPLKNPLNPRNK